MACDLIIAADNARFGQPEIKLGVLPGLGDTQRLSRTVDKAKAMDLCLTGRMMDAAEAERTGLVSRIVATDRLLEETISIATTIAAMPQTSVRMIKESINHAYESNLAAALRFEYNLFSTAFASDSNRRHDRLHRKTPPVWKNR